MNKILNTLFFCFIFTHISYNNDTFHCDAKSNVFIGYKDRILLFVLEKNLPTVFVKMALKAGANSNARYTNDNTPLHAAAYTGNAKHITTLMQYGANPNASNTYGITPLYESSLFGNLEAVTLLLDHGATDIKDGYSYLCEAIIFGKNKEVIRILLDRGDNVHTKIKVTRQRTNNNVEIEDYNIVSLLHVASHKGNTAYFYYENHMHYYTARSICGSLNIIKLLIDYGINPNERDSKGRTALCYVMDPNNTDYNNTDVATICSGVLTEIVTTLLISGVDPTIPDNNGKTSLDYSYKLLSSIDNWEVCNEIKKIAFDNIRSIITLLSEASLQKQKISV